MERFLSCENCKNDTREKKMSRKIRMSCFHQRGLSWAWMLADVQHISPEDMGLSPEDMGFS